MARISLRAYNRDIEVMIDKNQTDEAFAHCRYILELYPKHIDTYRLMGKALLEAQRFSDASDVFHRVLSSVPDDFIAHLGMSIIREDESNLDAAIWHMERSFEVQPSNAAVQVELRRLYGLRDGVTPQKIQLTRGALARMSAKSNLYTQAIAELRTALSNDPQRPDLQVVLAEMYLQTGARMEAIETCNSLINKLPYCQTANRILAEVLPDTERADQAQEYKTRSGELDPYYLQLSPVAPTLEQVPDGAVTIERFEYAGESFESSEQAQPSWAASLGVDLEDEETISDEPAPDWLQESESETEGAPVSDDEAETPPEGDEDLEALTSEVEEVQEVEQIPDWMNDIDESETEGAHVSDYEAETPLEGDENLESLTSEVEEVQEVEQIPDWMNSADESEQQEPFADQMDIPSAAAAAAGAAALGAILSGQQDEQLESEPEPELEPEEDLPTKEAQAEPLPDWMAAASLDEAESTTEETDDLDEEQQDLEEELPVGEETGTPAAEDIPEWMGEADQGVEGETPDWLRDAMESPDEEGETLPDAATLAVEAAIMAEDEKPDPEAESTQVLDDDISQISESELEPDELIETADDTEQESPAEDGIAAGEVALVGAAVAGAALSTALDDDDEIPPEIDDGADLSADEDLAPLPSEEDSLSEVEQDIPDWLQDLGEDLPVEGEPAEPVVFEDQPTSEELTPLPIIEESETEQVVETPSEAVGELVQDTPAAVLDETLVESEFPESIPDWLSEVSPEEIPEQLVGADDEMDIVKAEIPIWLQKMEAQHNAELEAAGEIEGIDELELDVEFTELTGEDVPSWLMSAMETELPAEVDEHAEAVEDISDVIGETDEPVKIEELGLESVISEEVEAEEIFAAESAVDDLEFEEMQDELAPQELDEVLIPDLETVGLEEIEDVSEEAADLLEPETEPVLETEESVFPVDERGAEVSEEEDEGIGVPGLVAAGAAGVVAAHVLDDEDTQPVAVTEEPEPGELDIKEEEELILESETEIPEIAEAPGEQLTQIQSELETELPPVSEFEEVEAAPIPADEPLTGEEQDEAMAWLESLAAKQGAAEEELLTTAEERLEEPPEWVQEEAAEPVITEEEETEDREGALAAAALAGVAVGALAGDEQTADEDELTEVGEEVPVEEPSEWVPEVISETEQLPAIEAEAVSEEIEVEPEAVEIDEEPDVVEELAAAAEVDLDQVEAEETPEEIPGWLSGLAEEQEVAAEPQTTDWSPDMLTEEAAEPEILPAAIPDEKLDLNAASLAQLERIPGIGFIHAQNIVNHRTSSGSFSDLEQLEDVEGITPEISADLKDYLTIEVVSEVAATDSEIPELQEAWNSVNEGNIDQAVDQYAELIYQDRYLDEIIRDLQSALGKYPTDSSLYQSLGDAYMRANMLQEALDAYNRAEDLFK